MAEGARLESVFTRKGNVGSNPTLSARPLNPQHLGVGLSFWSADRSLFLLLVRGIAGQTQVDNFLE